MSDPVVFMIEAGELGLMVVDKAAVGYLDTWQAPGGKSVDAVALVDYDTSSGGWSCQSTSGALVPSANTTTQDIPPTLCVPGKTTPTPGETSFSLDVSFLQDPNVSTGLAAFLYEFDTEEAYFYFGMDDGNPPRAIGRVRLAAGMIGGAARSVLTADVSFPLVRRADIEFGDVTTSRIVLGVEPAAPLAATATTKSSKSAAA